MQRLKSALLLRHACAVVLWLFFVAAMSITALANLGDANFWFDESGQFWMAKGLNHYSEPHAQEGGVDAVLSQNRTFNLDPGGFTVLLHCWVKLGSSPSWLRALPFAFFVLGAISLALTGWRLTQSPILAAGSALLVCFGGQLLYYAFELRAYSMEYSGVLVVSLALVCVFQDDRPRNYFLLGVACAVFLTARYSFLIYTFAACAVCVGRPILARQRLTFSKLLYLLAPPTLSGLLIYNFMLSGQNPAASPPVYVEELMLRGKSLHSALRIIKANLGTKEFLPIGVAIATYCLAWGVARSPRARPVPLALAMFAPFAFTVLTGSVFLSLTGKYPWAIQSRWGVHLHALSLLAVVVMAAAVKEWVHAWMVIRRPGGRAAVALVLCCSCVVYGSVALSRCNRYKRGTNDSLFTALVDIDRSRLEKSRFFVGWNASPTVRYLFEYGPLQYVSGYPAKFTFETYAQYNSKAPLPIAAKGIDIMLLSHSDERERDEYMRRSDAPFKNLARVKPSFVLETVSSGTSASR